MRRRFFGETQINFNRYCTIKGNEDNVEVTYSKDVFYTVNYKNWNLLLGNTSIVINKNQLVSFKAVEGTTQSG